MKKKYKGMLGGVVVVAVAAYFALWWSPIPQTTDFSISLEELRREAQIENVNALPIQLNSLIIARVKFLRGLVIAGGGFKPHEMALSAFQLRYPDRTYIIDSAYDRAMHEKMNKGAPYSDEEFSVLQKAMTHAKAIFVTHEHADHIGGIAASPVYEQIKDKLMLTREQIESQAIEKSEFPKKRLEALVPLTYTTTYQVAPGFVLFKTPGHSPGSQSMFIHLKDGREFLLIGDIAWSLDNIRLLRTRPWLISYFMLHEDRQKVVSEIRALYNILSDQNNKIIIVPSHDTVLLGRLSQEKLLPEGF